MSRSTFAPLLARAAGACLLLALAACDKSGVHDLGRANDTLSTCGSRTSTWLRSLDEETELFVLGSTRPGTGSSSGCFVRALVNQDSSVAMETGTYSVDGGGAGSTSITATYRFLFQPDRGPLQREGAVRFDQDPPITQDLRIGMDAAQLTIDVDGDETVVITGEDGLAEFTATAAGEIDVHVEQADFTPSDYTIPTAK